LQSGFYLLALWAFVAGLSGFADKLPERSDIYLLVFFMALDISGLLVSTWGFGMVHFLL
jgi:hypothetical protein